MLLKLMQIVRSTTSPDREGVGRGLILCWDQRSIVALAVLNQRASNFQRGNTYSARTFVLFIGGDLFHWHPPPVWPVCPSATCPPRQFSMPIWGYANLVPCFLNTDYTALTHSIPSRPNRPRWFSSMASKSAESIMSLDMRSIASRHWSLSSVRVRVQVRPWVGWYLLTHKTNLLYALGIPDRAYGNSPIYYTWPIGLVVRTDLFGYFWATLFYVQEKYSH